MVIGLGVMGYLGQYTGKIITEAARYLGKHFNKIALLYQSSFRLSRHTVQFLIKNSTLVWFDVADNLSYFSYKHLQID